MKVERTGSVRGARAVGAAAYAKQAQAVAAAEGPVPVGATASVLGIPEATVRTSLFHGRARLRVLFSDEVSS